MHWVFIRFRVRQSLRWIVGLCLTALLTCADEVPRVCGQCGHEAKPDATHCAHCAALLPEVAQPASPDPGDADHAELQSPATQNEAFNVFDTLRLDVQMAREEASGRPHVALALYENAMALLTAANPDDLPPGAGQALLDGLRQSRTALGDVARTCNACGGSGRRQIAVARLEGGASPGNPQTAVAGSTCPICGGTGRIRVPRDAEGAKRSILQGQREAALMLRAAGRVPLGRAWIPPEWEPTLSNRQKAAIRQAVAPRCPACAGLGIERCRTCRGTGAVVCRAPGCRQGWIERSSPPTQALTPRSLHTRTRCTQCNGTGKISCVDCRGTGQATCRACKGRGEPPSCHTCGGSGLLPCRRCAGKPPQPGAPPCPECGGEQVVLCRSCQGDGKRER